LLCLSRSVQPVHDVLIVLLYNVAALLISLFKCNEFLQAILRNEAVTNIITNHFAWFLYIGQIDFDADDDYCYVITRNVVALFPIIIMR
jgi:hypothetical protein